MSKIGAAKIRIDVTKIDKSAIYHGEKGKYMDVVVNLDDEPDQYGQHGMVTQDIGQERRQSGDRGPILGNVQKWWPEREQRQQVPETSQLAKSAPDRNADDDIPF